MRDDAAKGEVVHTVEPIYECDERGQLYSIFEVQSEWATFDFLMFNKSELPSQVDDVHAMYAAVDARDTEVHVFVRLYEMWLDLSGFGELHAAARMRHDCFVWGRGEPEERLELENVLAATFSEFREEMASFVPTRNPDSPGTGTYYHYFPHLA
ncbi:hypothetical protein AB0N09_34675 [Streptomyces erythrochromogenes]|uniref:hypothetical protein n=1 Tax=Streptomyces erythrochromogenes TaxID=285574 RepID=UPI003417EAFD